MSIRIWYVISIDKRKLMFSEEKRVFITDGRKLTFTKSDDKNDAVSLNLNFYPQPTVSSHFSLIIKWQTRNGLQMYISCCKKGSMSCAIVSNIKAYFCLIRKS